MNIQAMNCEGIQRVFCSILHDTWPRKCGSAKRRLIARAALDLSQREQGGALVEMAISLPLMMLLITGMISFGILLSSYLMVSHAVDVGARNLAVSRGTSTNPCSDAVTVIQNAAPSYATANLTYTFQIGADTFSGASNGFSGTASTDCSVAGVADMVSGGNATVSVTYPFQLSVFFLIEKTINVTATTSEVIQ